MHSLAWRIGTVLSFCLYYSGICALYTFVRRTLIRRPIVLVLTYHRIDRAAVDHVTVLQRTFDGQVDYLSRHFSVVTLDELVSHYQKGLWPDADMVAITFDDGYWDNLALAAPILKKHGIPACVFVTSGWIGSGCMLTCADIIELRKRGFTIGAHTVSHPRLSELRQDDASKEIKNSKSTLEELLKEEILYFAYPKGKKDDVGPAAIESSRAAGFKAAFSTENGLVNEAPNIFFLPRLGIRNIPLFVFKVRVSGIFESPFIRRIRKLVGLT